VSTCHACHGPVGDDGLAPGAAGGGPGVWVAFNYDGSAFVPFASELEALRHASSYHMPVTFIEYGDEEWMRK
jgi:mono/diheme cytochrome c family protein